MASGALALVEHTPRSDGAQPPRKYKYEEFDGPRGEEYLNVLLQQMLPFALWRTWHWAVSFQAPGNHLYVSAGKLAERVRPGERKVYLDLQALEAHSLLQITHVRMEITQADGSSVTRVVAVKNFERLYDLAHEYHEWIRSPDYLPPARECIELIQATPDLVKKLIRFDNYRRLLLCQKPGRKPKPKEDWYSWEPAGAQPIPVQGVGRTGAPKVNLYFNGRDNEDSPKRISSDSPRIDSSNIYSFDSEAPSNVGEDASSPSTSACSQKRACSGRDYTKVETNETHNDTLPTTRTNTTNHLPTFLETGGPKRSTRRESAELEPTVRLARQAMALTQGRQTGRAERSPADDGKPRPKENEMVSSFIHEFGPVLGDRNKKGSITGALRTAQAAGLERDIDILMCLVRAYAIARNTREVRPQHRHEDGDNRMPVFSKMLKTFAEAWAANNFSYSEEDLIADIAADERLRNWVMERGLQQPAVIQSEEPAQASVAHDADPEGQIGEAVVDTADLRDFWLYGGAQGLEDAGYRYVDLDGDLLTCQAYEQRRRRLLERILATEPLVPSPVAEYELQTYLTWVSQLVCPPEREAELLANLPPGIQSYLSRLEEILDPQQYAVSVLVAPISHRRVIEVSVRSDPAQAWLLSYPKNVDDFIKWWQHTMQLPKAGTELSDAS